MIIKKLVTELGFKINKTQAKAYFKLLKKMDKRTTKLSKKISKASKIKFDSKGLNAGVASFKKLEASAGRFGAKLDNIKIKAKLTGKSLKKSLSARIPTNNIDAVNNKLEKTKRNARGVKSALIGLVAGLSLGALAVGVFKTNTEFIKLKASLKTATGGVDQAEKAFQRIEKFASQTPFDLAQSVRGFVQLTNLGLKPTDRSMRSFGNTATAMGKSLNQMVEAVADAATGEFERLKEFGIKSKKQGKQVEFTFKGIKTTVKNDSKSIQEFLVNLGETNFAGAMADQMNTLPGIISNLKDNFGAFQRAIGEGGLNAGLEDLLSIFRDLIGESKPLGAAIGNVLGNALKKLAGFIRLGIEQFQIMKVTLNNSVIGRLAFLFSDAAKQVKSFVGELVKSEGFIKLVSVALVIMALRLQGLVAIQAVSWLIATANAIRTFGLAAAFAQGALAFIPIIVGAIVGAVAILAAEFISLETTGESLFKSLAVQFPQFAPAFNKIAEIAQKLRPLFKRAFEALKKGIAIVTPIIQKFIPIIKDKLSKAFKTAFDKLKTIFNSIAPLLMAVFEPIKEIMLAIGTTLITLGIEFFKFGKTAVEAVIPLIKPLLNIGKAIIQIGLLALAGLATIIKWGVQFIGVFVRVAARILIPFARFFVWLVGRLAFIILKIIEFGAKIVSIIIKAFTDPKAAIEDFKNLVKTTAEFFKNAFVKAVDFVIKKFASMFKLLNAGLKLLGLQADKTSKKTSSIRVPTAGATGGGGGGSFKPTTKRSGGGQSFTKGALPVKVPIRNASVPTNVNNRNSTLNNNSIRLSSNVQQTIQIQNAEPGSISSNVITEIGNASQAGTLEAMGQQAKIIPRIISGVGGLT